MAGNAAVIIPGYRDDVYVCVCILCERRGLEKLRAIGLSVRIQYTMQKHTAAQGRCRDA